ncbi:MAG: hypothetical protein AAF747_08045 [Planctomycetota bacterium]
MTLLLPIVLIGLLIVVPALVIAVVQGLATKRIPPTERTFTGTDWLLRTLGGLLLLASVWIVVSLAPGMLELYSNEHTAWGASIGALHFGVPTAILALTSLVAHFVCYRGRARTIACSLSTAVVAGVGTACSILLLGIRL